MMVNCDVTMFTTDVDRIARDLIIIFFKLKNLNILYVKRYEDKLTIYLVLAPSVIFGWENALNVTINQDGPDFHFKTQLRIASMTKRNFDCHF